MCAAILEMIKYVYNLNSVLSEEALGRTLWRNYFRRGYGPVVRQTAEQMNNQTLGLEMVQAVNRRPVTAKACVQFQTCPSGICDGQTGTRKGFPHSTLVFLCQPHSSNAPHPLSHSSTAVTV